MHSVAVWLSCLTTSGECCPSSLDFRAAANGVRLLDKIAKDIQVVEKKTITRWDGTIGEYKNHLRKKMITMGAV